MIVTIRARDIHGFADEVAGRVNIDEFLLNMTPEDVRLMVQELLDQAMAWTHQRNMEARRRQLPPLWPTGPITGRQAQALFDTATEQLRRDPLFINGIWLGNPKPRGTTSHTNW